MPESTRLYFNCVKVRRSGNHSVYSFTVSGMTLAEYGVVCRFEDDPISGVQRGIRGKKVLEIMGAMRSGEPLLEGMVANLAGSWLAEGIELVGDESQGDAGERKSYLEVIDGQHRMEACARLIEAGEADVVRSYEFEISAIMGASDEIRRALFMAQFKRLPVDRALALALQARARAFTSDTDRHAWAMVERLNSDPASPLNGRIFVGEGKTSTGRDRCPRGSIPAVSLMMALRTVTSNSGKNPLRKLEMEQRYKLVRGAYIGVKANYTRFLDPDHILGQKLGILAIVAIVTMPGAGVTYLTSRDFSEVAAREMFAIGGQFQWKQRSDAAQRNGQTPYQLGVRWNEYFQRRLTE